MKGQDRCLFIFCLLSRDPIFVAIPDPSLMPSPCEHSWLSTHSSVPLYSISTHCLCLVPASAASSHCTALHLDTWVMLPLQISYSQIWYLPMLKYPLPRWIILKYLSCIIEMESMSFPKVAFRIWSGSAILTECFTS
jgi:hypothetical protein